MVALSALLWWWRCSGEGIGLRSQTEGWHPKKPTRSPVAGGPCASLPTYQRGGTQRSPHGPLWRGGRVRPCRSNFWWLLCRRCCGGGGVRVRVLGSAVRQKGGTQRSPHGPLWRGGRVRPCRSDRRVHGARCPVSVPGAHCLGAQRLGARSSHRHCPGA